MAVIAHLSILSTLLIGPFCLVIPLLIWLLERNKASEAAQLLNRDLEILDDKVALKDASDIWGKDAYETQDILRERVGKKTARVACIGPASERLSLISGIVNDRGRIAARSGVGAVMGSKRLKALAVRGHAKVPVANPAELSRLAKAFATELRDLPGMAQRGERRTVGNGLRQRAHIRIGRPVADARVPRIDVEDGAAKAAFAQVPAQDLADRTGCIARADHGNRRGTQHGLDALRGHGSVYSRR